MIPEVRFLRVVVGVDLRMGLECGSECVILGHLWRGVPIYGTIHEVVKEVRSRGRNEVEIV